jgi:hypothetical protein
VHLLSPRAGLMMRASRLLAAIWRVHHRLYVIHTTIMQQCNESVMPRLGLQGGERGLINLLAVDMLNEHEGT